MTRRVGLIIVLVLLPAAIASGQGTATQPFQPGSMLPDLGDRATASSVVKWLALATVVSVVPAIAVLVTSFTRIIVVLGLLRQGLGTHQLPPNTVLFGLAVLATVAIMSPVFEKVYADAVAPFAEGKIGQQEALAAGGAHVRRFMRRQITGAGNDNDVRLFLDESLLARADDLQWRDVPTRAIIPAFVVSELKVAFLIGFRILLPFVIIDMLVASILTSMGMLMLPPALISLPFKLLLFVLADGWHLVMGMLIESFS